MVIKKRTEPTGSGRGRTVVIVVSDREVGCDEGDYQEADCMYGEDDWATFQVPDEPDLILN